MMGGEIMYAEEIAEKVRGKTVADYSEDGARTGGWPTIIFTDGSAIRVSGWEECSGQYLEKWKPYADG